MSAEAIAVLDAFEGHAYAVAFAPHEPILYAGGFGGEVKRWETAGWSPLRSLNNHEKSVNAIVFSADGTRVATSSSDKMITIQQPGGEPELQLKGHRNTVMGLSYSPDGSLLASGASDSTVRLWDLSNDPGGKPRTLKSPYRIVSAVAFTNDGRHVVSAGGGDEVLAWSVDDGEIAARMEGHGGGVRSMELSPDGLWVLAQAQDGAVSVWSTADWTRAAVYDIPMTAPRSAKLSRDGQRLAVMEERKVRLLALPSLEQIAEWPVPVKGVHLASFSPDDSLLAVTAADGQVRVWETGA